MIVEASLVSFLKTGRIGPIRIGTTIAEVERLLGRPEDVALTAAPVWLYGSVELGFTEEATAQARVFYIQVERQGPYGQFAGHGGLVFRDELPPRDYREPDFETFVRFARTNNVRWVRPSGPSPIRSPNPYEVYTEGGVVADFAWDEEAGRALFGTFITEYTAPERLPEGFAQQTIADIRQLSKL
jgi:hypothetical protein